MRKTVYALLIASMLSSTAHANDADGQAGATIVAPLIVTKEQDLYFGTVAPSLDASGTVIISPRGRKNCSAEVSCLSDDHTNARFRVTGAQDATYTITLPSQIQITNSNGDAMLVDNFQSNKASGFLRNGRDRFRVGGTLNVAANQAEGDYTGAFTVTVDYQ